MIAAATLVDHDRLVVAVAATKQVVIVAVDRGHPITGGSPIQTLGNQPSICTCLSYESRVPHHLIKNHQKPEYLNVRWRTFHAWPLARAPGRQEYLLNGSPPSLELSKTPLPTTQLRWRPHAAASKTQSATQRWKGDDEPMGTSKIGESHGS